MRYENIVSPAGAPIRGEPQLLSFVTDDATEVEQKHLRLKPGVKVHRIRQMRRAEGRPLLVKDVVISAALFPKVDETTYSVSAAARASGVLLGPAEERIAIEPQWHRLDAILDVAPMTPLLRLDRTSIPSTDGRGMAVVTLPPRRQRLSCPYGRLELSATGTHSVCGYDASNGSSSPARSNACRSSQPPTWTSPTQI